MPGMLSKSFRWFATGPNLYLQYHCATVAYVKPRGGLWVITLKGVEVGAVRSEAKAARWVERWARHNAVGTRPPKPAKSYRPPPFDART